MPYVFSTRLQKKRAPNLNFNMTAIIGIYRGPDAKQIIFQSKEDKLPQTAGFSIKCTIKMSANCPILRK